MIFNFDYSMFNPKNWFLKDADRKIFIANRTLSGKELEERLNEIEKEQKISSLEKDFFDKKISINEFNNKKATLNNEPYVAVIDIGVDKNDTKKGFFELDWNDLFVEQLISVGYTGLTQEAIVNQWFDDICNMVAKENGAVFPEKMTEFDYKTAKESRIVKADDKKKEIY